MEETVQAPKMEKKNPAMMLMNHNNDQKELVV